MIASASYLVFFSSEFCYHGQQKEKSLYVCELCQKHGKGVGSVPSIENGKTQAVLSEELKTVFSDTELSRQVSWSHGKV